MEINLQAEKEASAARKAARMAEADEVFQEWYRNVESRVREVSGGEIFSTLVKRIETNARCWCGAATLALGLCKRHYEQWWNGIHKHRNLLDNQIRLTEEERKLADRSGMAAWRWKHRFETGVGLMLGRKNAWLCEHTDRVHKALGLCRTCYSRVQRGTMEAPPITSVPRLAWKCKHKDRPHAGYGLCNQCNTTRWRHATGRQKPRTDYHKGVPLKCGHPYDPKTRACDGVCRKCYDKRRTIRKRKGAYVHPKGSPLLCGCTGVPHNSKGCCRQCYRKGVWKTPEFFFTHTLPTPEFINKVA